jgi:putative glutamine amidotransferase
LIQHIENPDMHGQHKETTHPVRIKNGKWLKSIFKEDTIIVNSNHHQAVASAYFPSDYVVTALSDDGIIEAMEYSGERFILGVQWHPERIDNEEHKKAIFEYFINVTRERISI